MLLRFLCSLKAFLNYVPGVYRYLKATGVSESQAHFAFRRKEFAPCGHFPLVACEKASPWAWWLSVDGPWGGPQSQPSFLLLPCCPQWPSTGSVGLCALVNSEAPVWQLNAIEVLPTNKKSLGVPVTPWVYAVTIQKTSAPLRIRWSLPRWALSAVSLRVALLPPL